MKKKFLTLALTASMVLGSVFSAFAAPTSSLETGLTGYYSFDNTLTNSASNGGAATLHGGAGETWNSAATGAAAYATGKNGQAYSFTGPVDDSNNKGEGLQLDVTLASAYTISFWANPDTVNSATSMVFCPVSLECGLNIADNWFGNTFPTVRMWGVDSVNDAYLDNNITAANELCGQWTYITLTCDAQGAMTLYINGTSEATGTTGAGALNGMPVFLGINFWDNSFDGLMDDVAVYNRALTATEVSALYNNDGVPADEEDETTTTSNNSGNTGDVEDETSTTSNNSGNTGDVEDETTAPSPENPTEEPTTEGTTTVGGVITEAEAVAIQAAAVLEGAPEGAELKVTAISSTDEVFATITSFASSQLKNRAFVAADLKLMKEGVAVQPDGKIKVTLPVMEALKDAKYIETFRMDDTTKEFTSLGVVAVKDGKFTMETDHFSTYVFAAADAPEEETTAADATVTPDGKTGDTAPIVAVALFAALGLAGFGIVSFKKKNA